jgi:hypothetical protein
MDTRAKSWTLSAILALTLGVVVAPPVHSENGRPAGDSAKSELLATNPVEDSRPSSEQAPKANFDPIPDKQSAATRLLILLELLRSRR